MTEEQIRFKNGNVLRIKKADPRVPKIEYEAVENCTLNRPKKIVAFLQNMWFKDPPVMQAQLQRFLEVDPISGRERFIRTWLFWSCLTGKRLRRAFGQDLCDEIIWEEGSPEIGGKSSSVFKPKYSHIHRVIEKHNPAIILAFGKVVIPTARLVVQKMMQPGKQPVLIVGPHPAARGGFVVQDLADMTQALKELL